MSPDADRDRPRRPQPNNPLHGITLKMVLEYLVDRIGWEEMAAAVDINCFHNQPSINSSLKFLRSVPWARTRVEQLYLRVRRRLGD